MTARYKKKKNHIRSRGDNLSTSNIALSNISFVAQKAIENNAGNHEQHLDPI